MKIAILSLMLVSAGAQAAEYSLKDSGHFAPAGHRVEFADRFGWDGYQVKFDFGLDEGRSLSKKSNLSLVVKKKDGTTWEYSCKAKGRAATSLVANVNYIHSKGISVVAECRIDAKEFAEAVGLHPDDVGIPNLVFHAVIHNGEVRPGAQRGLYFQSNGVIESAELNAYATAEDDASNLAVLFRSNG